MRRSSLLKCYCVRYVDVGTDIETIAVHHGCPVHDIECAWCSSHTDRGACADSPDQRHEMVQRGR